MKFPKLIVVPVIAMLLAGCGGGGEATSAPTSAPTSEPGIIIPKDEYYDTDRYNLNGTVGAKLQFELHKLMLDSHSFVANYKEFNNYTKPTSTYQSIDKVNANTDLNELFYTGKQVGYGASTTREHVWPCAKSAGLWVHSNYTDPKYYVDNKAGYWGGGSDLYHVRPCTSAVNSARGDSKYKEFTDEEKSSSRMYVSGDGGQYTLYCYDTDANHEFAQYSEPADQFKGDIARIIMYVYIHYTKMGDYNWAEMCGNLKLKDIFGDNTATDEDVYNLIVKWNELDLPSETEKLRNNTVMGIQGNRNPFVDYPHLVRKCFAL